MLPEQDRAKVKVLAADPQSALHQAINNKGLL
jgi:hypothetical protein